MTVTFKDWIIENSWAHKAIAFACGLVAGAAYVTEINGVLTAVHLPDASHAWGWVARNVVVVVLGGGSIWLTKIKAKRHAADPKPQEPPK